ncbi:SRPBCC family protein [Streptomyces sp. CRN 30]|uniref:SRPBCC family protein n=1 Tax=Streptomyces sp. CRN 30 TaxID=3075613 RepID=UPI002A8249C9|nr:SRPBCC family protein [Streptomyces sp. CRN 30]
MALFALARVTPLPPDETWRRLTDWERHADVVPLTRITVLTSPPTHTGTSFVGRTGLGPLGFDDPMEVVVWEPPTPAAPDRAAHCRLEKRGGFVKGWAEIEVQPHGAGGSRAVWREELSPRLVPSLLDRPLKWAARWVFGRAVDRLLGPARS